MRACVSVTPGWARIDKKRFSWPTLSNIRSMYFCQPVWSVYGNNATKKTSVVDNPRPGKPWHTNIIISTRNRKKTSIPLIFLNQILVTCMMRDILNGSEHSPPSTYTHYSIGFSAESSPRRKNCDCESTCDVIDRGAHPYTHRTKISSMSKSIIKQMV